MKTKHEENYSNEGAFKINLPIDINTKQNEKNSRQICRKPQTRQKSNREKVSNNPNMFVNLKGIKIPLVLGY